MPDTPNAPYLNLQKSRVKRTVDRTDAFSIGRLVDYLAHAHMGTRQEFEDAALVELKRTKDSDLADLPNQMGGTLVNPREAFAVNSAGVSGSISKDVEVENAYQWLTDQAPLLDYVTVLDNLVGNVTIPGFASGATIGWNAEGTTQAESTPTLGSADLTPHTLSGQVKLTKQSNIQSGGWLTRFLREHLGLQIAEQLMNGLLNGTGLNNQPTGLLATTGVLTSTYAMDAIAYSIFTSMRSEVAGQKIPIRRGAYLVEDGFYGELESTSRDIGSGKFIVSDGDNREAQPMGFIGRYPALESTLVPENAAVFGAWENLFVGMWAGVEMVVDGITDPMNIKITALQMVDVGVTRPAGFVYLTRS